MNIVIAGYYGFGNAGDELILESILALLRDRYETPDITVLSRTPGATSRRYGVRSLNRWNCMKVVSAVKRSDMLVMGGGGLFQDTTGSLSLYYYLGIMVLAKLFGKKVFACCIGVNPLHKLNGLLTACILNLADQITVRESESAVLLCAWGGNEKKIELVADPVLLMNMPLKNINSVAPRIAFVLRPSYHDQRYAEAIAQLADSLVQRLSAKILFIPFQPSQDNAFSERIRRMMNAPAEIMTWGDTKELCTAVGTADLLISQRLHGLILAALWGIPIMSISEDPKIIRFMKELGQKNIHGISQFDHYSLLPLVLDVWEWRDEFRKNAHLLLPAFKARANRITELLPAEIK